MGGAHAYVCICRLKLRILSSDGIDKMWMYGRSFPVKAEIMKSNL